MCTAASHYPSYPMSAISYQAGYNIDLDHWNDTEHSVLKQPSFSLVSGGVKPMSYTKDETEVKVPVKKEIITPAPKQPSELVVKSKKALKHFFSMKPEEQLAASDVGHNQND